MLEKDDLHCIGMKIRLWPVNDSHLVCYQIQSDGTDGCRVCFAAREFAVGLQSRHLDGSTVVIKEIVLPDDENSTKRVLFHRNHGYTIAEMFEP